MGKVVAEMLNWKFVDLDKLIMKTTRMHHDDYMKQNGEDALTALEQKLTLELNFESLVFAPPGSMIYSPLAMDKIKQNSTVVYLKTVPETIEKRMGERLYKNGIVGLKEKGLKKLMEERAVLYEKFANYTFNSGDQSKEEMAKKVIDGLIYKGLDLKYAIS